MKLYNRVILIILDSAGAGFLPDASDYGDLGANTLGHIGETVTLCMPNLGKMGLGNIININGTPAEEFPSAKFGRALELSKGKDTTIGHWEIAGIVLNEAFPTFPDGFPEDIIVEFENLTGRKILGNKVASGTEIISELGDEHVRTGYPIIYTSADSVFQIAAHEEVIPIEEQYAMNETARKMLDKYKIARVIARPFTGTSGSYARTANRHDFSLEPVDETVLDRLKTAGKDVLAVGKIYDIFSGKGITGFARTSGNMEGVDRTIEYMQKENSGLIFTNLVDFDMLYGHRRDAEGYKKALESFDARVPEILSALKDDDLLIISADHGCDPTFKGTDHTREYIPLLVYSHAIIPENLGIRRGFNCIADTIDEVITGVLKENSLVSGE
ncbi:MAG: phosphopentomutase [Spirochaetes bacterium]|nr:phosphopentomutase [Spirochaetota bacterium]